MAIDLEKYLEYAIPKPTTLSKMQEIGLITAQDLENAKKQSMVQGLLGAGLSYLAQPKTMGYGSALDPRYLAKPVLTGLQAAGAPYQNLTEEAMNKAKLEDIKFELETRKNTADRIDTFVAAHPEFEDIKGLPINEQASFVTDFYKTQYRRKYGTDRFQNQYLVRDNDSNQTYNAVFDKSDGKTYINVGNEKIPYQEFAKGKNVSIFTAGGAQKSMISSSQFNKLRQGLLEDEIAMKNLTRYINNVQDLPTGYKRLGNQLSQWIKGMANDNDLTEQEVAQRVAEGRFQGLIGANRIETVGGGVMTEFDAQRVMQRLGGDPAALTTQPAIVVQQISDIFRDKYGRYQDNLEAYNIEVESGYTNYKKREPIKFSEKDLKSFSPEVVKELGLSPNQQNIPKFNSPEQVEQAYNAGQLKDGDTVIINGQEFTIGE